MPLPCHAPPRQFYLHVLPKRRHVVSLTWGYLNRQTDTHRTDRFYTLDRWRRRKNGCNTLSLKRNAHAWMNGLPTVQAFLMIFWDDNSLQWKVFCHTKWNIYGFSSHPSLAMTTAQSFWRNLAWCGYIMTLFRVGLGAIHFSRSVKYDGLRDTHVSLYLWLHTSLILISMFHYLLAD